MFLRSLTLRGFKSFAEPTTLELEPGLTAVVGPNGSGKSNVVDAVAWVLGAQSPRSLRSGRMDDVVFAGNGTRGPLGRAEVSLTIDNSAGLLPIEFSEVTITRTLFRTSGESEYAINGVPCRLLDVTELLSDTGVGRQQHVIVSQGQLGAVLEARPEERRLVVEEAAGILKFRRRKERAERRLAATEANLERLGDLAREVRRQRRPLERQAEAARRQAALSVELDALRLHLLGRRLARHRAAQAEAEATKVELASAQGRLGQDLRDLDHQVAALEAALGGDEGAWLSEAAGRLEALRERARGLATRLEERATGLAAALEAARGADAVGELAAEAGRLGAELATVEEARGRLGAEEEAQDQLEEALDEDRERLVHLSEAEHAARQVAEARGELAAVVAAGEEAETEARAAAEARAGAGRWCEQAAAAAAEAEVERSRAGAAVEAARRARAAAGERRREADAACQAAAEGARAAVERAAGARGRVEALAAHGGPGPELASVEGVVGSLLAAIDVDAGWERAVEAALSRSLNASVVADVATARRVLERHPEATVLVPAAGAQPEPGPASQEALGAHVRPSSRLSEEQRAAVGAVLARLLEGVELAPGWAAALAVAAERPAAVVVTAEGGRFAPGGWHARPASSPALALAGARQVLEAADEAAAEAADEAAAAASGRDGAADDEQRAAGALEVAEVALARASDRSAAAAAELARAEAAAAAGDGAVEAARRRVQSARARARTLEGVVAGTEGPSAATLTGVGERLFTDLRQARHDLARRADEVGRRRASLAARRAELAERASQLERQLQGAEQRLLLARSEATLAAARLESQRRTLAHVEGLAAHLGCHRQALGSWAGDLAECRERHRARRAERASRLDGLRRARAEAQDRLEGVRDQARRVELAGAEARLRLETTLESLRQELDADAALALAAPCPPLPEGVSAPARLRELERELRQLGPVNPLAVEELAALDEREGFLTAQLDDVKRSRRELAKVIRAVDAEMTTRLSAAVADVVEHFAALFETLFPGGSGRLVVTDPDNLLESGIEIEARPGGKRPRKLSLLSGGERSLCALAFYFAVFRSRPSPFYLLDEVEAALDDMNLHRFLRLLDEFRGSSQLLVVTHQKRTMEAADSLYGVTMAPGGSSRVVSERLRRPAPVPAGA